MTTPSGASFEYPTLFVPSDKQQPSSTSAPAGNSNTDSVNMTNETRKDSGWFTAFAGETSNNEEGTPSTFNTQTAASWLSQRYRPWSEFFNTRKFGLPNPDIAVQRLRHNFGYFTSNYLCIFVVLLIYCILTSIILLLALIALAGLFYTIRQKTLKGPVVIAGQEVPPAFMYSLAIIVVSPLLYLGDTSGVIGWVFGTSVFMIFLHAILYISEEIPGAEFEVVTIA